MTGRVRVVAAGIIIAAVLSSYWWAPRALRPLRFFGVRRVDVSGTRYLTAEAVVRGMGLRAEASVFDDLGAIERRLEAVGGIARASVARRLPATLLVQVTEVEPVALAASPDGLVALAADARPLPYDVASAPVDAPIVRAAHRPLLEGLAQVQTTDPALYAEVAAARVAGGAMVLDMTRGRVLLDLPVDPGVVQSVSSVRRDLASRGTAWRELDGRFRGWVVVRRDQPSHATAAPAPRAHRAAGRKR